MCWQTSTVSTNNQTGKTRENTYSKENKDYSAMWINSVSATKEQFSYQEVELNLTPRPTKHTGHQAESAGYKARIRVNRSRKNTKTFTISSDGGNDPELTSPHYKFLLNVYQQC